jgi:cysteinyl-tRNA synthetase
MALMLYNTLSRKKEIFSSLSAGEVLYYTCGPTVHDYAHIGNFRTFVFQDVLKRWLIEKGFRVKHVMNITDVDEKTIERSARKGVALKELTYKYENFFFEDLDCLNIKRADQYPRVSDNIELIARMVKRLREKRHTITDEKGSIYYDINTFESYGQLSGNTPKRKIRAKMPREDYKVPKNFLLWENCEQNDCIASWDTVLGRGLPGWHIECAALAEKYLGETIDIHSGGVDLIFPHHENEIAEAESYSGKPFTRFWVHVEHLLVYGRKMSKSLGNFYTLRQIIRKGFDARAMRLVYLKTHYRENLDFDFEKLVTAQKEIDLVEKTLVDLKELKRFGDNDLFNLIHDFKVKVVASMDDDLHTERLWLSFIDFLRDVKNQILKVKVSKEGTLNAIQTIEWVDVFLGIMGECKLTQ